jgi:hypothetical protein
VVGTSRLPLTSVEAPLPDFTLGQLGYFFRPHLADEEAGAGPMPTLADLLQKAWARELNWLEKTKLLELLLRAAQPEQLEDAANLLVHHWRAGSRQRPEEVPHLLRSMFNDTALSPYTDFVPKTLAFLHCLVKRDALSVEQHVDFVSYLLRQLGRHLTAYDLVVFHHRGANYPDIQLLDAALKEYLNLIERHLSLFLSDLQDREEESTRTRRRRALRQAWYLRRYYEGHPVPDSPTSPGENARILPSPYVRVPELQILDPSQRSKRLFVDDPLSAYLTTKGQEVLRQSILDLRKVAEVKELGMALFLERPLGVFKHPNEPDQTPLFSYEAFSASIAGQRLAELRLLPELASSFAELEAHRVMPGDFRVEGLPLEMPATRPRLGAVSLADALKVASDFVLLRTTQRSLVEFLQLFDWSDLGNKVSLDFLFGKQPVLILPATGAAGETEGRLWVYDSNFRKRIELQLQCRAGYTNRGGVESPTAGLKVVRYWNGGPDTQKAIEFNPNPTIPAARTVGMAPYQSLHDDSGAVD